MLYTDVLKNTSHIAEENILKNIKNELHPENWTVKKSPEDYASNFRDNFIY